MLPPRARWWLLFAGAALFFAVGTHRTIFTAGNDASRWAQIEAIVDFHSTSIERSRYAGTVDRVVVGERVYSNKPPAMALAGAALYAPLEAATGWRLGDPATAGRIVWLLTWLLVGLPAAGAVAAFDRLLADGREPAPGWRIVLTVSLAAGTLLWPYAVTFANHVPATALLVAALVALRADRPLAAGLATGLAGAVDYLPGFGLAPFLAAALPGRGAERRTRIFRFALGILPGGAAALGANFAISGSPLPAKMLPGAVDLSAQAGPSLAGVVLPQSWSYPIELLFGGHGLLTVSPVLLFGLAGMVLAVRSTRGDARRFWFAMAAGVGAQYAGHALLAGSYGGWAYGYRYLVPVTPLLLLSAPFALVRARARRAFLAVAPVSILFAALGAYHPWPPAFEQASHGDPVATLVHDPIGGNAAAFCAAYFPGGALERWLGSRFVSPDPELRRRYYAYFFGSKGDLATMKRFR